MSDTPPSAGHATWRCHLYRFETISPETAPPDVTPTDNGGAPGWVHLDGAAAPRAPESAELLGIDPMIVHDLALRLAHTVPRFTTDWIVDQLRLPKSIVDGVLERLNDDRLIEVLGPVGPFSYRWATTEHGHERAGLLMQSCGYVGPAPVGLDAYAARLEQQLERLPRITPRQAAAALNELVLPPAALETAGLAVAANRSLFLFGPPGNGKTSIGHLLHRALAGRLWVPHAIAIGHHVVRIFDPQFHRVAPLQIEPDLAARVDQRWVRVERPFVVVAGDLSLHDLDLAYSPATHVYEAPLHVKANGGIFLLDDFGCQRADPHSILNRWVFPLETGTDYLTLHTGQKLAVPFRQMLIVSTNLNPDRVMDAAFLRRMGYRILIDYPSRARWAEIFRRYAAACGLAVPDRMIERLLDRYEASNRPLRGCEPRDLIERVRDICSYHDGPFALDDAAIDLAWKGYFGE